MSTVHCTQVFDVVREQITRALQYQLTQLDQLRTKLGHLAYQDITNLWQAERVAKEHDELLATPIQYTLIHASDFVFRLRRVDVMWTVAIDDPSVCQSACHVGSWYKNGLANQHPVWDGDSWAQEILY